MNTYLLKRQGDSVVAVKHDVNKEVKLLTERMKTNKDAAPYIEDELVKLNQFNETDKMTSVAQLNGNVLVKLRGKELYGNETGNGKYMMAAVRTDGPYEISVQNVNVNDINENDPNELARVKKLTVGSFINLDKSVVWRVK